MNNDELHKKFQTLHTELKAEIVRRAKERKELDTSQSEDEEEQVDIQSQMDELDGDLEVLNEVEELLKDLANKIESDLSEEG